MSVSRQRAVICVEAGMKTTPNRRQESIRGCLVVPVRLELTLATGLSRSPLPIGIRDQR